MSSARLPTNSAELRRLAEDQKREGNWKRWGPYLSERQWGTVREDYSEHGTCWDYFPHDHARSRAYRWGEDGLLGLTDRQCRLCFSPALWNGKDPILKERLYGLTGPEGNHGEDVKECYYYLDATPTTSYARALYKYPQGEFPYARLLDEARRRGKTGECELADLGAFEGSRYFDLVVEYAKAGPEDILVRLTAHNRGPDDAPLHLLGQLWFRNTWSWGRTGEGYSRRKPALAREAALRVQCDHESLGRYAFACDEGTLAGPSHEPPRARGHVLPTLLFTENETNFRRLYGSANPGPAKDAFHEAIVNGQRDALSPRPEGTKCAAHYEARVPAGGSLTVRLRISSQASAPSTPFGPAFDAEVERRRAEADEFYAARIPSELSAEERLVSRQAYAGLLWTKQFYYFAVKEWLEGDPAQPAPPPARALGRNRDWDHLYNRDVISMPDKWEYPWYAAWDLAFHMLPMARVDPHFAKSQLVLMLREWYMHPNGQIPAYEFAFGDVNPPVHAWAVWRVYKMTGVKGARDRTFLARCFQKMLLNFTWWVNRKDVDGKHIFSGGFLGLDNIGVFDRSRPLPTGGHLEQADGTAWMAFYCATMLSMALELAQESAAYEDLASKFFEHFVAIVDAMNNLGGTGLWNEEDGFYYDQLHVDGRMVPLRLRSMVGIIPLFAVEVLDKALVDRLPEFKKRTQWFLTHRPDLSQQISWCTAHAGAERLLLAIPSRERLVRVLRYVLDEGELLSPHGIRSLSAAYRERPFVFEACGERYTVGYTPAESDTGLFGGNSNWRGPVWFPVNYLLIEALERYHHFYGDTLRVECPTGSGRMCTLAEVARELEARLISLFLADDEGHRPCHGRDALYAKDPAWRELVLFYEYFHGDTGRGVGASHQTGWTALVAKNLDDIARARRGFTDSAATATLTSVRASLSAEDLAAMEAEPQPRAPEAATGRKKRGP